MVLVKDAIYKIHIGTETMTNSVTCNIPYPDVIEARRLGINISEVARNALRQRLVELKSEKEAGIAATKQVDPSVIPLQVTRTDDD